MAASATVTTGNGELGDIVDWSVQADITPTVIGDGGGGVGNLNLSTVTVDESIYINNNTLTLSDPIAGDFIATVDQPTITTAQTSLVAGGILSGLNTSVIAPPMYGSSTLQDAYSTYVGLCYDTPPSIDFSGMTSNPTVAYEGWSGNCWDYIRNLAAFTKTEVVADNGVIIVRDLRQHTLDSANALGDGVTFTSNTQDTAREVQVVCRNSTTVNSVGDFIYNYALNPSVETNATDWSYALYGTTDVTGPQSYTTVPVKSSTTPAFGTSSYRGIVTAGVKSDMFGFHYIAGGKQGVKFDATNIATGTTVYAAISIRPSITQSAYAEVIQVWAEIRWYTASGAFISTTTGGATAISPTASAAYYRQTVSSVAPANATQGILYGYAYERDWSSAAPSTPTLTIAVDGAFVSTSSDTTYKDGSSVGWSWSGTTNNSTSFTANPSNTSFYNALLDNNTVLTVNAGETLTGTVTALGSPAVIVQPVRTTGTTVGVGQYIISASDGLVVQPGQFEAWGGSFTVSISDTPNSIDYVFRGPTVAIPGVPSPYSIAVSDGTNSFATLNIAGAGVLSSPTTQTYVTGAADPQTPVIGPIDSPFASTLSITNDRGIELAHRYGGGQQQITFALDPDDSNGFADTEGSAVNWNENIYRVNSTTTSEGNVDITAVNRALSSDFTSVWSGATGTQFTALWDNKPYTGSDFTQTPLRIA